MDQWKDRWEALQLLLEVYQFARDAAVAEAWLFAQEPYLMSGDLGESLDETLALLKKHLAFERAAATQEERFHQLRRLTTLELKAHERTLEMEATNRLEKERRIQDVIREFAPPPPTATAATPSVIDGAGEVGQIASSQSSPSHTDLKSTVRGTQPVAQLPLSLVTATQQQLQLPPPRDHEGTLTRKHEWESTNKKASARSWHELFIILSAGTATLSAYKDQRHARDKPRDLYHHEAPISLIGASAAPAVNYAKRPHVFRLKLANGGETLFQAHSDEEMAAWVAMINSVAASAAAGLPAGIGSEVSGPGASGRAATLPSGSTPPGSLSSPRSGTGTGQGVGASSGTPGSSTISSQTGVSSSAVGKKKFFTLGGKKK
ncbi:unnamed protein product [Protopolystoma xenopodis]|uniref:PH domain-containing protein n=1 Tax=Protopolystoma xenopodis TaxID=117903 RepID=A0A3S5BYK8_9PLAT|nr:unnamed protein product [Protopolystoma xenopodis]